jgi:glycosyltransferase involved in cell wall biosynthesis
MNIAIAHDYLTQRGGAERVVLAFTRIFPHAPVYTSVYDAESTFREFSKVDVRASPLQSVGWLRRDPRLALPVLPAAWAANPVKGFDAVLVSSSGWAHSVKVSDSCRRIVYCHNPARWLYQQDVFLKSRLTRTLAAPMTAVLRRRDVSAAQRCDKYVANSSIVAARIRRVYGIEAEVVHPPVSIDVAGSQVPLPGIEPGFWLAVARGRGYKNVAPIVQAIAATRTERLVVVGQYSPDLTDRHPSITWTGVIDDDELRWLYANARALVSVSDEDFGLTPLEANSFGTPAAVIRAGGFLDSTAEGESGVFIPNPTQEAVAAVLRNFPDFDRAVVQAHAKRFDFKAFETRILEIVKDV